jgi:hypothetical protein
LVDAPEEDLLITDIRVIQAGAWEHDLYLKTDVPALLAPSGTPKPRQPSTRS